MEATRRYHDNRINLRSYYFPTPQVQYYGQANRGWRLGHIPDDACQTTATRHQGPMMSSIRPTLRTPSTEYERCFKCGKWIFQCLQEHFKLTCPAKSAKCFRCGKLGHFSRACFNQRIIGNKSVKTTQLSNQNLKTKSAYRKARDAKRIEEFLIRKTLSNSLPFLELSDDDFVKINKRNYAQIKVISIESNENAPTNQDIIRPLIEENEKLQSEIQTFQTTCETLREQITKEKEANAYYISTLRFIEHRESTAKADHEQNIGEFVKEIIDLKDRLTGKESEIAMLRLKNEFQKHYPPVNQDYQSNNCQYNQQSQQSQQFRPKHNHRNFRQNYDYY